MGKLIFLVTQIEKCVSDSGQTVIYVDQNGLAIEAQKGSVFRANVVTPEIDSSISGNGFLTGKSRGVVQNKGAALPLKDPIEERVVQYVEGSPFPRDSNFVGFKKVPHDALNTAIRTGRQTLKQEGAILRLDEVSIKKTKLVNVEDLYSKKLGREPREPIDVKGEFVHDGDVSQEHIVKTSRLTKNDINKIKKSRKPK